MITEIMNFLRLNAWHRAFLIRYIRSPALRRNILQGPPTSELYPGLI